MSFLALMPLIKRTIDVNLNSAENSIDLFVKAGSPPYPVIARLRNTAAKGASNTSTPAVKIGAGWKRGSLVLLTNQSTITGATGSTGADGSGGAGGLGGQAAGTASAGSSGGSGASGGTGGPSLQNDAVTGVRVLLDNSAGSIVGGPGGTGGAGGGGGGGGGGSGYSDIRLKFDIVLLFTLDTGVEVYQFKYLAEPTTTYVGVIAQQVQPLFPEAVSTDDDGFLKVDYDTLNLKLMRLK